MLALFDRLGWVVKVLIYCTAFGFGLALIALGANLSETTPDTVLTDTIGSFFAGFGVAMVVALLCLAIWQALES